MMEKFCQENITVAVFCLFGLAVAELIVCAINGNPPVHTGTCVGAIAGVIIPKG